MTAELSVDEKIGILNSHKKNIAFNKYNLVVSLMEENAKDNPNQSLIADHNAQMAQMDKQIEALQAELETLIPQSQKQY